MDPTRRKALLISSAVIIFFIIFAVVVSILSIPKEVKTGIMFVVVPDKVSVKTGDRSFKINYNQSVSFEPGTYTLKLSAEHFTEREKTVTVKANEVTPVYMLLKASDDTGKKILSDKKYGPRIERIGGFEVTEGAAEISKKYTFVNKLPITGKYFYIYPCIVDTATKAYGACVKLALAGDYYKDLALAAIKAAGIDTTSLVIQYKEPVKGNSNGD